MRSIGHFIGGKEVKGTSGRTADVFEPMTGDVQAKVALASKAEVRAAATLATMMGTLVLSRVAGSSEFSDEILAAGREAALGRAQQAKAVAKKPAARKAAPTRQ